MAGCKVGGFLAAACFFVWGWGCGSGSDGSDADDGDGDVDFVGDPLSEDFILTECPAGTVACGAACVDTSADHANCGGCGNACLPAEVCNEGSCDLECPSGRTNCFGSCVDLETDFLHCGGCSSSCSSGEACVAGVCGPDCIADGSGLPCASGADCCSGTCETYYEDTDGDTYGNALATASLCAATAPDGFSTNGDDCYDESADVFPGQTACFNVERGDGSFDYDCSGTETRCGTCSEMEGDPAGSWVCWQRSTCQYGGAWTAYANVGCGQSGHDPERVTCYNDSGCVQERPATYYRNSNRECMQECR